MCKNIFDEEWWSDEVDLTTVTIGNMSVDSTNLLKWMASEVGTEKSQLTPVQAHQL